MTQNQITLTEFKYASAQNMRLRHYQLAQALEGYLPRARNLIEHQIQQKIALKDEISRLEGILAQTRNENVDLRLLWEKQIEAGKAVMQQLKQEKQENRRLQQQVQFIQTQVETLKQRQKAQISIKIQLNRLIRQKNKILQMLRSTKEFEGWIQRADHTVGSLSLLSLKEQTKSNRNYMHYCACNPKASAVEQQRWISSQGHSQALALLIQNDWKLNQQLFDQLIFIIAKHYNKRQNNLVSYLKQRHKKEVAILKRTRTQPLTIPKAEASMNRHYEQLFKINPKPHKLVKSHKRRQARREERQRRQPRAQSRAVSLNQAAWLYH